MATRVFDNLTIIRTRLREYTPKAWTDQELLDIYNLGVKDLWRAINDQHENHFVKINSSDVWIPAGASLVAGLPDDVFRVIKLRPRVVGEHNANPSLIFKPARGLQDPRFIRAEARSDVEGRDRVIWYVVINEGPPVGPPDILIAPTLSTDVVLQLSYNKTLPTVDEDDWSPIPGESDNALIAWTVAYAHSDDTEEHAPDANWLSVYATEKTNLLKQIGPRQVQEPTVVEGMFEDGADDDDY